LTRWLRAAYWAASMRPCRAAGICSVRPRVPQQERRLSRTGVSRGRSVVGSCMCFILW
jgi:hypothetical protein